MTCKEGNQHFHDDMETCHALFTEAFQFAEQFKIIRCACKDGDKCCLCTGCVVCQKAFECFLNTLVRLGEIIEWRLTRLGSYCVYVIVDPCV